MRAATSRPQCAETPSLRAGSVDGPSGLTPARRHIRSRATARSVTRTLRRRRLMKLADLNKVAVAMVAPGKGLLAADESSGTIKKRFDAIKVESTEDYRRDYREMLF